jgi:hypothetical protein
MYSYVILTKEIPVKSAVVASTHLSPDFKCIPPDTILRTANEMSIIIISFVLFVKNEISKVKRIIATVFIIAAIVNRNISADEG